MPSECSARLDNMATRARNRHIFKWYLLSHRPIHHLFLCQNSGEQSRALGPLVSFISPIMSLSFKKAEHICFEGVQWLSAWLKTEGPWVQASPASLRCGPWARHIYPSLVLVHHRMTCPCLTERLLMGRKESNQTKHIWFGSSIRTHYPWLNSPKGHSFPNAKGNTLMYSVPLCIDT